MSRSHRFPVRFAPVLGVSALLSACPSSTPSTGPSPLDPSTPDQTDPTQPPPRPRGCELAAPTPVPVLPRTSNDEVRHLVEDLLHAPVDAGLFAAWTPLAEVHGFDTLTESRIDPQALSAQFDTMAAVADALVADPALFASCPTVNAETPLCAVYGHYDSTAQFSSVQGQDCWSALDGNGTLLTYDDANQRFIASDPGLFLWNTGLHPGIGTDVIRRFTAPLDGGVVVGGSAFDADPGGGDGVSIVIRTAAGVAFRSVIANGGASDAWNIPLQLRRGEVVDVVVERNESNAYDTTGLTLTVDFTATPSSAGRTWENCAGGIVDRIASRAWRRPLRSDETASLRQVFDEVSTSASSTSLSPFQEALTATLQAALLSPNVHYKPELVPGGFAPEEEGFRVASRLALFFRGSFADDELWSLASANALNSDDAIRAQASRLLEQNLDRFVDNFAAQWLGFRAPPPGTAQTDLQLSMRKEAHDVFAAVLAEGDAPEKLLAPGFTIVDGPLAAHYGLPLDPAAGPTVVATSERGGLLTQGHMLTSTATGSDFKRVIHRGIWTLNRTLCQSVPELDQATREEINASIGAIAPGTPLAEQMEIHRGSGLRCTSCHSQMDPLGLALEAYDNNGLRRSTYEDGSSVENGYDFNGTALPSPEALSAFITTTPDYKRCVAEKLLTFGMYRAPTSEESCALDAIAVDDDGATRSLHDMTLDAFVTALHQTETP